MLGQLPDRRIISCKDDGKMTLVVQEKQKSENKDSNNSSPYGQLKKNSINTHSNDQEGFRNIRQTEKEWFDYPLNLIKNMTKNEQIFIKRSYIIPNALKSLGEIEAKKNKKKEDVITPVENFIKSLNFLNNERRKTENPISNEWKNFILFWKNFLSKIIDEIAIREDKKQELKEKLIPVRKGDCYLLGGTTQEHHDQVQGQLKEIAEIKNGKNITRNFREEPLEIIQKTQKLRIPLEHQKTRMAALSLLYQVSPKQISTDNKEIYPSLGNLEEWAKKETGLVVRGYYLEKLSKKNPQKIRFLTAIVTQRQLVEALFPNDDPTRKSRKERAIHAFLEVAKKDYFIDGAFTHKWGQLPSAPLFEFDRVGYYKNNLYFSIAFSPYFFEGINTPGEFQLIPSNLIQQIETACKKITNKQVSSKRTGAIYQLFLHIMPNRHNSEWFCEKTKTHKEHSFFLSGPRPPQYGMIQYGFFPQRLIEKREWKKIIELGELYFTVLKKIGLIESFYFKGSRRNQSGTFHWINRPLRSKQNLLN